MATLSTKIPLIIVNYKRPESTLACLRSVRDSTRAEDIVPIVVDSGPDREWSSQLSEFGDWTEYIPLEENLGFSGANNAGIRFAQEKYHPEAVVLLNDDTTVANDTVELLIDTLQKNPNVGAVVPKIYFSAGKEFHPGYAKSELGTVLWYAGGVIDWKEVVGFHRGVDELDRGQYDRAEDTEFVTGCCVALRMSALEAVGLFDERYFLYLEDLDLSCRLLRHTWSLRYEPRARVWHDNAGSSGSGSDLHQYYFVRNRYLFGFRYAPLRTKLFLLKHLVIQWQHGNQTTKQAILDFLRGNYGRRTHIAG